MDKKEKTTDFDLSLLTYKELIELYEKINNFLDNVKNQKSKYDIKEEENE